MADPPYPLNPVPRLPPRARPTTQIGSCAVLQVSRRLTRRIRQALAEGTPGHVRVGVSAYVYLLDHSSSEDRSYSLNYFNQELIHPPEELVRHAGRAGKRTPREARGGGLFLKQSSRRTHMCWWTRLQAAYCWPPTRLPACLHVFIHARVQEVSARSMHVCMLT
eukprot:357951-Chlamydomonas_euryale.AAC.14